MSLLSQSLCANLVIIYDTKLKAIYCSGLQWHNIHTMWHENQLAGSNVYSDTDTGMGSMVIR